VETDRLPQILKDLGNSLERMLSSAVVQTRRSAFALAAYLVAAGTPFSLRSNVKSPSW
jgi:hypothetical protein